MEIKNVRIYGLEESIIASGYPYKIETPYEEQFNCETINLKHVIKYKLEHLVASPLKRIKTLANAKIGSGHNCALKGIIVQYDLTAPEYFWRQFDRYHFHDYVSSESKMTSILKFDISKKSNKYVSQKSINELQYWVDLYNNYEKGKQLYILLREGKKIDYTKENLFQIILSNCPMGFQLTARITDNYLQLKSKYYQRVNHKLIEWREYCSWIKTLPMAKELIINEGK